MNLGSHSTIYFLPTHQRRLAMQAGSSDSSPVLIVGQSGTGKGAMARWIHETGPRTGRPLHEYSPKLSISDQILAAHGSTLVVTEIGSLPMGEQAVLSSFLKSRTVLGSGLAGPQIANTRVIATTSGDIGARARAGLFNSELATHLNGLCIEMPPLVCRSEDLEEIVNGLVREITHEIHKDSVQGVTAEALQRLREYEWPGNIRELRNVLKIAVVTSKGPEVGILDLPEFGHEKVDFRATRKEFEKIYLAELMKSLEWDLPKAMLATRLDLNSLRLKLDQYGLKETELSS